MIGAEDCSEYFTIAEEKISLIDAGNIFFQPLITNATKIKSILTRYFFSLPFSPLEPQDNSLLELSYHSPGLLDEKIALLQNILCCIARDIIIECWHRKGGAHYRGIYYCKADIVQRIKLYPPDLNYDEVTAWKNNRSSYRRVRKSLTDPARAWGLGDEETFLRRQSLYS